MIRGSATPSLPLAAEMISRWGLRYDETAGVLHLTFAVPEREGEAVLGPFRVGRTVIRLTLRRRPSGLRLRVAVSFGPPIRIEAEPAGVVWPDEAVVDDVPLGRRRVAFEARAEHEVWWRCAG